MTNVERFMERYETEPELQAKVEVALACWGLCRSEPVALCKGQERLHLVKTQLLTS